MRAVAKIAKTAQWGLHSDLRLVLPRPLGELALSLLGAEEFMLHYNNNIHSLKQKYCDFSPPPHPPEWTRLSIGNRMEIWYHASQPAVYMIQKWNTAQLAAFQPSWLLINSLMWWYAAWDLPPCLLHITLIWLGPEQWSSEETAYECSSLHFKLNSTIKYNYVPYVFIPSILCCLKK